MTKVLYYLYWATAKWSGLFSGRLTKLGALIIFSFPFLFMVALAYYRLSTFYLFILLALVCALSFLLSLFRRLDCELERRMPFNAIAGKEMVYEVVLSNRSKKVMRSAFIDDSMLDKYPTCREFLLSKEPGESQRNIVDRFLKYYRWMWLTKRRSGYISKSYIIPEIKPSGQARLSLMCIPSKRGLIEFGNSRIFLSDPFGIFQKSCLVSSNHSSVVVLPERFKLPELVLEGVSRTQLGGMSESMATGQTDEVVGLRDYRAGDPPKHIHWRSWAKTGRPVVREYENVFFPRYGLLLDTACNYKDEEKFEIAVSTAASFVQSVETRECLLELIFLNQGAKVQTVGKGVAKTEEMLELLARVDIDLDPDWDNLSKVVLYHAEMLTTCIVIFVEWDVRRIELLRQWNATSMRVLAMVIVDSEELIPAIESHGAVAIRTQFAQEDLITKLSQFSR